MSLYLSQSLENIMKYVGKLCEIGTGFGLVLTIVIKKPTSGSNRFSVIQL